MEEVYSRGRLKTKRFKSMVEQLGYAVEEDEHTLSVYCLSGKGKTVKNRIAWINKTISNHFRIYSIDNTNPDKDELIKYIVVYAATPRFSR